MCHDIFQLHDRESYSHGWCVLAPPFSSGCHSWDVHVGHNQRWAVGVCLEPYRKKRYHHSGDESWYVEFCQDQYRAVSSSGLRWDEDDEETSGSDAEDEETSESDEGISVIETERSARRTVLSVNRKIRRIRIRLDLHRGQLSFFSDPDSSNTHLYTFPDTFKPCQCPGGNRLVLFPCIYNGDYIIDDGISLTMLQGTMEQEADRGTV